MLTKDLLKYTTRGDKVHPKYLNPTDAALVALARELEDIFQLQVGSKQRDLDDRLKQHPKAGDAVFQGLCKLLEDRCEFGDLEDTIEEQRWQWMEKARQLRLAGFEHFSAFQQVLAAEIGQPFADIEARLFADLPEFRELTRFQAYGAERLVHRYNLAQVQGLLLRASKVTITVRDADLLSRRRLLQKLRFCRLLAEFQEQREHELQIEISGPLDIFEQSQSYGLRLCQFFPYVLLFQDWSLEAELRLGEKHLQLQLDGKKPIRSHYQSFTGYIPEEFQEFIRVFNALPSADRSDWVVEEGRACLNLGQESYCMPDLTFKHPSGGERHIELFHRWHARDLRRRLDSLRAKDAESLVFGVAQELKKDTELESWLAGKQQKGVSVFTFRQFPTVKAILTYLGKVKVVSGVV